MIHSIDIAELNNRLKGGASTTLLDVRRKADAEASPQCIGGAAYRDPEQIEEWIKELKPKRWKFPQNPYANTDYTAYTLEWGEVKAGIGSVSAGVAPRFQLGTIPVLDVLQMWNLRETVSDELPRQAKRGVRSSGGRFL